MMSMKDRRGKQSASVPAQELKNLIHDLRVQIIGPLRQEIFSGIRSESQLDQDWPNNKSNRIPLHRVILFLQLLAVSLFSKRNKQRSEKG